MSFLPEALICSLSFSDTTLCFDSFRTFLILDDFFGGLDLMLYSTFMSFSLFEIHLICIEHFYRLAHVSRNPSCLEFFLCFEHLQCWINLIFVFGHFPAVFN